MIPRVVLRSGRRRQFAPRKVIARDARAFERWLERQEQRDAEHGPIAAILMALMFYCDPNARCVRWYRKEPA